MIEKRTVFILGAGASCPYGFPTGRGLRAKIIGEFVSAYESLLDERKKLGIDGINEGYPSSQDTKSFVTRFDESSTESIDLFLSRHPQFERIGKIAIALTILNMEHSSRFRERMRNPSEDWYFHLFNSLTRELAGRDGYRSFARSNVAFVTFNYDRSLEYFLFNSLLHAFEGADPVKVEEQILRIPIIHVYGQVAPLQWHDPNGQNVLKYGKCMDSFRAINWLNVINCLYVVREERRNPNLEQARDEIEEADRVFFLGFGYGNENLKTLGFPNVLKRNHHICGTAMGLTAKEMRDIAHTFVDGLQHSGNGAARVDQQVQMRDCDCVHLLREFL